MNSSSVSPDLLDTPVVLLARGGSGSRLLSLLGRDNGMFTGNKLNDSGDCLDMVEAVYHSVIRKFEGEANVSEDMIRLHLRSSAAQMLINGGLPPFWGFKLPELMFLVPEINQIFSNARYAHLIRDPLTTCLRQPHLTAMPDNRIGALVLPLAYQYCGVDASEIGKDSPAMRMAYTTIHQVQTVREYCLSNLKDRYFEVRFEDILDNPAGAVNEFSKWLGVAVTGAELEKSVDKSRASNPGVIYSSEVIEQVGRVLEPLRKELDYI